MTNYRRGLRAEYAIRDILRAQGYDVTRSAGSRGNWDLIAVHPKHVRLIQVKTNSSREQVDYAAMASVYKAPRFAVEVWRKRGRRGWQVKTWRADGSEMTMEY